MLSSASEAMRSGLDGLIEDLPRPETDALARALPRVEALLSGAAAATATGATAATTAPRAAGRAPLERERERLLEQLLDARQELRAVGAVEDAVVADQ